MSLLNDINPEKIVHNNSPGLPQNLIPFQIDLDPKEMVAKAHGNRPKAKKINESKAIKANRLRHIR